MAAPSSIGSTTSYARKRVARQELEPPLMLVRPDHMLRTQGADALPGALQAVSPREVPRRWAVPAPAGICWRAREELAQQREIRRRSTELSTRPAAIRLGERTVRGPRGRAAEPPPPEAPNRAAGIRRGAKEAAQLGAPQAPAGVADRAAARNASTCGLRMTSQRTRNSSGTQELGNDQSP